uniref:RNA helicase n=1 Tax=Amorphochlora amoebiformis TaxID=1561963 RepID=A0A0H5BQZ8_9EUKA|nr:putative ATP-dependent RNA helicase CDC28 [Amorphochlora amoebiformis]|mmetsp:Transcript_423/g.610  ORF Transcript_423/g.610 Transcript_423/m.610 type:complete len:766 (+) Transcript_423:1213-3510(+)
MRNSNKPELLGSLRILERKKYIEERLVKKINENTLILNRIINNICNSILSTKNVIKIIRLVKTLKGILFYIHFSYPLKNKVQNPLKNTSFLNKNINLIKLSTEELAKNSKMIQNFRLRFKKESSFTDILNDKIHTYKAISLPIKNYYYSLMKAIDCFSILIIIAETGAGKTTQIPKYLFSLGYSKLGTIGITQPRRIATINVAKRVCMEMQASMGNEIGYSVRFEDVCSVNTRLKFMTDGIMIKEVLTNPTLNNYSIIMLDEAHERTLYTDILFCILKDLIHYRKDLKLLISSATINYKHFSKYFYRAPLFQIPGRLYRVEIYYSKESEPDYVDSVVSTIFQIHLKRSVGDILAFLTGQDDIELTKEIILGRMSSFNYKENEFTIFPLYSSLGFDAQNKVFKKTKHSRKIVLATNIAETSITINGIRYVIDSGLCKLKYYNSMTKFESLIVKPISKASCWQRSGRAGRTSDGKCFRLYTINTYKYILEPIQIPEIQRANIDNFILVLKCLGINNIINFQLMDNPSIESIILSLEQLYLLGALSEKGILTKIGRCMNEFPLKVNLSKMLMTSEIFKCSEEIAILSSILSTEDKIINFPKNNIAELNNTLKKFNLLPKSDMIVYINIFKEWVKSTFSHDWAKDNFINVKCLVKSRYIFEQLINIMEKINIKLITNSSLNDNQGLVKCIISGLYMNSAIIRRINIFKIYSNSQIVIVHPTSCISGHITDWIIFYELIYTNKEYINVNTEIQPEWLLELAPLFYKKSIY